jgi:hypothetical protein
MKSNIIGISGLARCGKDSFFNIASSILSSQNIRTRRFAFADCLKSECNEILEKYTGISAFTEKTSEKEIIRPLLVTYGTHIRRKINPNCWIDKINDEVKSFSINGVSFITDVRFENEIDWVRNIGGKSIHITREGISPPNKEEAENDPILLNKSDIKFTWKNFEETNNLIISKIVKEVIQSIL